MMAKKKKLTENPTHITRKFSTSQQANYDQIREQVEEEIKPKPVSVARIALAKLRNVRRKANVSLTELARRTGMTKTNLSRLENSGDNVTLKTLERYAHALNVELVVEVKRPRRPAKV